MKNYKTYKTIATCLFFILICLLLTIIAYAEEDDWVEIIALSPNHYDNYTDAVTFTATINYSLHSKEQGIIYLGFNTDKPNYYEVDRESGDHVVVSKGFGTVTLTQTVTPVDWDNGISYMQQFLDGSSSLVKDFKVYANISEYPHDITWTPLAIYEAVVTDVSETIKPAEIIYGDPDAPESVTFDLQTDEILLQDDTKKYDPKLAHLLIALCNSVHNENNMQRTFENMGFTDYVTDYTLKDPLLAYGIAKKTLPDGTILVLVVCRGTEGQGQEFVSNFHMFSWGDNRHGGFSDAADALGMRLNEFLNSSDYSNTRFVFTGHSRGAAASNLLAVDMIDHGVATEQITSYNFACPDVERMTTGIASDPRYASIFNVGHVNDLVSWIPGVIIDDDYDENDSHWEKYGNSYWYTENWEDEYTMLPRVPGSISGIVDRINTYHPQVFYLSFLSEEKGIDSYKNRAETVARIGLAAQKRKQAREEWQKQKGEEEWERFQQEFRLDVAKVYCPVDVEIYDEDNHLMASTQDEMIHVESEGVDYVAVFIEGDKKKIYVSNKNTYKIVTKGTGTGKMMFEVLESVDETDSNSATKRYENVTISMGKTFCWEKMATEAPEERKLLLIDSVESGNVLAEIMEDGSESSVEKVITSIPPPAEDTKGTVNEKNEASPIMEESSFKSYVEGLRFIILLLAVVGLIAVVIFIAVIVVVVRKGRQKKASSERSNAKVVYCLNCGLTLPREAVFCPHCGKKQ